MLVGRVGHTIKRQLAFLAVENANLKWLVFCILTVVPVSGSEYWPVNWPRP